MHTTTHRILLQANPDTIEKHDMDLPRDEMHVLTLPAVKETSDKSQIPETPSTREACGDVVERSLRSSGSYDTLPGCDESVSLSLINRRFTLNADENNVDI